MSEIGKRISNPPWDCQGRFRHLVSHAFSLLEKVSLNYVRFKNEVVECSSELEFVFRFCYRALVSTGRLAETRKICEGFSKNLEHQNGSGTVNRSIAKTIRDMGTIKMRHGKLYEAPSVLRKE